jgi:FkbM family methyltransferase
MTQFVKNAVYALWNILTFGRGVARTVSGFRIKFPPKWSRYFESNYEKANVNFISSNCKRGMTFIDIGAHLGLMSVIAAKLVGPEGSVLSFEPARNTFNIFRKVISMNGLTEIVKPFEMAVSDRNTMVDFLIDENEGSNANSMVARPDRKARSVQVRVISLDSFVIENKINHVDFIKIDAEGVEIDVLKGASEVIRKFKPAIILAIHPRLIRNNGQMFEELLPLIRAMGYDIRCKGFAMSDEEFIGQTDFFDVHLTSRI